ncbi:hypothetical protein D6779_05945 [Candidatus Parcubacteria bacterium]|nr:MAG: hypothetical protein D6779_05945 [Candidatus Parcubacteria bacterium]
MEPLPAEATIVTPKQHTQGSGAPAISTLRIHLLLASLTFLSIGLAFFPSTGRDDAYITFWVAHTLSSRGQILNYNGWLVEQSSSLLYSLLLALFQKATGASIVATGHVAGIAFGLVGLALVGWLASRLNLGATPLWLVALSPYYLYWTFSGMETSLTTALYVGMCLGMGGYFFNETGHFLLITMLVIAALLVRPETFFVLCCVALGAWFLSHLPLHIAPQRIRVYIFLALVLIGQCLLFAFRQQIFGAWFPQPVAVKIGGAILPKIHLGAAYLYHTLFSSLAHGILAVLSTLGLALCAHNVYKTRHVPAEGLIAVLIIASQIGFIIATGGDWMENGRFLVPFWPLYLTLGWYGVRQRVNISLRRIVLIAFLLLEGLSTLHMARFTSTSSPLWAQVPWNTLALSPSPVTQEKFSWFDYHNRVHLRDIPLILRLEQITNRLANTTSPPETLWIMSHQMGMVPFHVAKRAEHIHFIDLYGLTDRLLSSCAVTRSHPRSINGIQISYAFFFANLDAIQQRCHIPKPDILFDLFTNPNELTAITREGYVIVYIQEGEIRPRSFFHGSVVQANQFIAVRKSLCKTVNCTLQRVTTP